MNFSRFDEHRLKVDQALRVDEWRTLPDISRATNLSQSETELHLRRLADDGAACIWYQDGQVFGRLPGEGRESFTFTPMDKPTAAQILQRLNQVVRLSDLCKYVMDNEGLGTSGPRVQAWAEACSLIPTL